MQAIIDDIGERMLSTAMEEGVITPEEHGWLCEAVGYWPHPAKARTALLDLLSEREARERRAGLVVVGGGHATDSSAAAQESQQTVVDISPRDDFHPHYREPSDGLSVARMGLDLPLLTVCQQVELSYWLAERLLAT